MYEKLDELTYRCMKCGSCNAVCPVLRELGAESNSPRARVRLVRGLTRDEVELTPRYRDIIGKCLNCRACAEECPSGVAPNEVVLNARNQLVTERGLPLAKRLIFRHAMRARRMFPGGAKLLGLLQRATLINHRWSPARLALPLMGMKTDKKLPMFALKPFLERVPEVVEVPNRKARVAYFVGCASNLILPEIGEAVVGLLTHHGVEVVIPKGQMCCGTPIFNSGDFTGASYFARQNLRAFEELDVDAIVTACGSCGLTWQKEWRETLGIEVPENISSRVYDISQFLTECLGISELEGAAEQDLLLTYHDPCHLARGMNVRTPPRQLLSSLPGVEYVEMADADRCCGGGGAFSIYYPDLSRDIGARKAENMVGSEANVIATGCPSCVMQLDEMLHYARSPRTVKHTACVLWDAVRKR